MSITKISRGEPQSRLPPANEYENPGDQIIIDGLQLVIDDDGVLPGEREAEAVQP